MFQNTYPVFEAKRLLKKEMLENLRDYPRNLFAVQYQNYSDGILFGCELKEAEAGLKIMPGILYYKGIPYFLEKPHMVSCQAEGKQVYLKVRFGDKAIGSGGAGNIGVHIGADDDIAVFIFVMDHKNYLQLTSWRLKTLPGKEEPYIAPWGAYTMLSSQQAGAVRPIILTMVGATLARP